MEFNFTAQDVKRLAFEKSIGMMEAKRALKVEQAKDLLERVRVLGPDEETNKILCDLIEWILDGKP